MTTAPESIPTHHARRTTHTPRPLPGWLQVGVGVLLLFQGVQTAAHWYHNATSQVSSVTATPASRDAASLSRFEYTYQPDNLRAARSQAAPQSTPQGRYDYDPYGTHSTENVSPAFQYSAYYAHAPSAMTVTAMHAYAPSTGRWVERDPLPEK